MIKLIIVAIVIFILYLLVMMIPEILIFGFIAIVITAIVVIFKELK